MKFNARAEALKLIERSLRDKGYLNRLLDSLLASHAAADPRDKALVSELSYGVLRNLRLLDFYLAQASSRKLDDIDPKLLNALRMGAYQLLFLDKIPDHAAVGETVNLAKGMKTGSSRFANAVLRSLIRGKDTMKQPEVIKNLYTRLAIKYSYPDWMIELFKNEIAAKRKLKEDDEILPLLEERLIKLNSRAPLALRANRLATTREKLVESLRAQGMDAQPGKYSPDAVIVDKIESVRKIKGYDEGQFMVQDEGSQLVVHLLSPSRGEKILDVGAAPGGKTTFIAEMMGNEGQVVALDTSATKVGLIAQNAARLGIKCVGAAVGDIMQPTSSFKAGDFDRVLVDAPCSSLGVLRRHPEAKWHKRKESARELAALQELMLDAASYYLRKKGVLVYSVCTTTIEEGMAVAQKFLDAHPNFVSEPPPPFKNVNFGHVTSDGHVDLCDCPDVDGFFAVRFLKRR